MNEAVDAANTPRLAVVIPAYNAEQTLAACLAAIAQSTRQPDEIILFNDGSTDRTAEIATAHGARVISNGQRAQGPAIGRNAGAHAARAATLMFIDADVIVDAEAIGRLEAPIASGTATATFGSYNARPRCRNIAAYYYNLRHHWVHQQGREDAFTFWSGLGAVRRDAFLERGGFDPAFRQPSIEDVDLGLRIIEGGGRIRLVKAAQATHWKNWTLAQLWHTDIFRRAVPWAKLIKTGRGVADDLNISNRERLSAGVAHLIALCSIATLLAPSAWPLALTSVVIYLFLNAAFFAFLLRTAGPVVALGGIALHWCYHIYASVTFVVVRFLPDGGMRKREAILPT